MCTNEVSNADDVFPFYFPKFGRLMYLDITFYFVYCLFEYSQEVIIFDVIKIICFWLSKSNILCNNFCKLIDFKRIEKKSHASYFLCVSPNLLVCNCFSYIRAISENIIY